MTNIRTPEGREELRRVAPLYAQGCSWRKAEDLNCALDGLDIAQKAMLALKVINWPTTLGSRWYWPYEVAAWKVLEDGPIEWDKWQEERG